MKQINLFKKIIKKLFLIGFNKSVFRNFNVYGIKFGLWLDPSNGELGQFLYLNSIFKMKKYEPKVTKKILDNLKKGKKYFVFLDIGANIGYYTNLVGKYLVKKGKVIAFEPLYKVYSQNKKSIEKNNLQNLFLYNLGAGAKNEEKLIYVGLNNVGGSSLIKNKYSLESQKYDYVEKIKLVRLDSFIKEKKIDLVKIDVEGYEFLVLQVMKSILRKKPNLIMEFSSYIYEKESKGLSEKTLDLLFKYYSKIEIIENGKIFSSKNELLSEVLGKQVNLYCFN